MKKDKHSPRNKTIGVISIIVILFIGYYWYGQKIKLPIKKEPVRELTDIYKNTTRSVTVLYNNIEYFIYYTKITEKNISLIPNFSDKKSASSIVDDYSCISATSGGFYTEDDKPLGLFRINGNLISPERKHTNLINGFFYLDQNNTPVISRSYPSTSDTVLQSGPYYINRAQISTVNDKPARRIVMIETSSGDYYLTAITAKELITSGPPLSDIGAILFSIQDPFTVANALNLDGGAASYYLGEDGFEISELTYAGSIICAK